MKRYLFMNTHNGHDIDYQPFELSQSISQDEAEKLMKSVNYAAERLGSSLSDLLEALDNKNIKFKQYKYIYHKPEDYHLRAVLDRDHYSTDPLPECMYSWDIIECIFGNY